MQNIEIKVEILCISGIESPNKPNKGQDPHLNRRPAFDLRHLEILRALVETGKTTTAAQRLGMSQSAISRGIAQLEAQIGRPLFDRQGGRLVPTVEAFSIHEQLETVFSVLEQIGEQPARSPSGVLRLTAPPTLAHRFMPGQIASFLRRNPDVEISFDVTPSDNLITNVAEERVDLGITDTIPTHAGVRSELLLETACVCLLPLNHRLAARTCIEPQDIAGEAFIALTRRHSGRFAVDQMFEQAGIFPRTIIETSTAVSAGEFVREGLGVALLNPFPVVDQLGTSVAVRPFRPRIAYRMSFLVAACAPVSAATAAFMAHTRAAIDARYAIPLALT
jgi:DNA-binding transcriptional LysR family regulator